MKEKTRSCIALGTSCIALMISGILYIQADVRADAAALRREKALIERYAPKVRTICKEFNLRPPAKEPETLDELIDPFLQLLHPLAN